MSDVDLNGVFNTANAIKSIFNGTRGTGSAGPYTQAQAPATGASSIDQLLAGLYHPPTTDDRIADMGSIAGAFSQGQKADRLSEGNFRQNYDQMMLGNELQRNDQGLAAQIGRNTNEADALRKLQQTSYLIGGGAHYAPGAITLNGQTHNLPSFSFAPNAPSDATIAGAKSLQSQLGARLAPGGSFTPSYTYQPTPVNEYATPGTTEKIGDYAGMAGGVLGELGNIFGAKNPVTGNGGSRTSALGSVGSGLAKLFGGGDGAVTGAANPALSGSMLGIGGQGMDLALGGDAGANAASGAGAATGLMSGALGKAIPIAGAVTGGIGLLHNQGLGKNMLNGATTGASIGSMVMPGLGTAVGAGIGAGVGALRGIGGPSKDELTGRQGVGNVLDTLTASATPAQRAEAQHAGWDNPEQALALIAIRDQLAKEGKDPAQANQLMDQLLGSTKGGQTAVNNAANQIFGVLR